MYYRTSLEHYQLIDRLNPQNYLATMGKSERNSVIRPSNVHKMRQLIYYQSICEKLRVLKHEFPLIRLREWYRPQNFELAALRLEV